MLIGIEYIEHTYNNVHIDPDTKIGTHSYAPKKQHHFIQDDGEYFVFFIEENHRTIGRGGGRHSITNYDPHF